MLNTAKSTPSAEATSEKKASTRIPSDHLDSLVANATPSVSQRSMRKNDAAKAQKKGDDDVPTIQPKKKKVTDEPYKPLRSPGKTRTIRQPRNTISKLVEEEKDAQERVQQHVGELEKIHEKDMQPLRALGDTVSHLLTEMAHTWSNVADPRDQAKKQPQGDECDDVDSPQKSNGGMSPGSNSSGLKDCNNTTSTKKRFFAYRTSPSPPKPTSGSKKSVAGPLAKKTVSKSPPKAREKNLSKRRATKKSDSTQTHVEPEAIPALIDSDFWNKQSDPVSENGLSALTAVAVEDHVFYSLPMFTDVSTFTCCTHVHIASPHNK